MRHDDPTAAPAGTRRAAESGHPGFGRRARRGAALPLVIEGEAVVVSRRSGAAPAQCREPAPRPEAQAAPEPRRPAARPRQAAPRDLIFSGLAAGVPAAALRRAERRLGALPLAGGAAAGLVAMAAVAFAAIPAPPPAEASALSRGGVTLSEVVARIGPRNEGEVLSVEGVIRNAGKVSAAVPPLKLSLSQAGGVVRAKPVVPLARQLGPGEVLRFQTMVAVPKGAVDAGSLDIGFAEPRS